jgi:hypothetical protein
MATVTAEQAAAVTTLPIILLFIVGQRYPQGIALTNIKCANPRIATDGANSRPQKDVLCNSEFQASSQPATPLED